MSLPGMMQHWGGIQGANFREMWQLMRKSEKFWWMTRKRSSEILQDEWKIFSRASKFLVGTGHPTASARHCSSAQAELLVPRSRTIIRQRHAFSVAGSTAWNGLPAALRLRPMAHSALFLSGLKTTLTEGWECSWVDYLEEALYKTAVIRIRGNIGHCTVRLQAFFTSAKDFSSWFLKLRAPTIILRTLCLCCTLCDRLSGWQTDSFMLKSEHALTSMALVQIMR